MEKRPEKQEDIYGFIPWYEAVQSDFQELLRTMRAAGRVEIETLDRLLSLLHDIKGAGGSFGFPLLTDVARSLHRYVTCCKETGEVPCTALVEQHVDCLNDIVARRLTGEQGAQGEAMLATLRGAGQAEE